MAQQNSFDIVSEVNLQEVDNAVNQAQKEIIQRYDFKGIRTSIELDQKEKNIVLTTGDEFHMKSVVDILQSNVPPHPIHLPTKTTNHAVHRDFRFRVGCIWGTTLC